jgi:RNA polymerase sigma-70 factor, ECF subfamily
MLAELPTTRGQVGFRSRTSLDDSPRAAHEMRLAIARAKEGDREAVRYLYVRFSDNVYGYVRSIVRDDHEAEDITQQVFAKLMTVLSSYNDCGVPFLGWLLRLSRNLAIDHVRRLRAIPSDEVLTTETDDPEARDRSWSLHNALSTLPEEQRNVVFLRHVIGLSPAEIADRMQRSESSVHGLHHRGRLALRRELCRLGVSPSTTLSAA